MYKRRVIILLQIQHTLIMQNNETTEAPVKTPVKTPTTTPKEPGVRKFPKVLPGPRA